jgi:WD40 repeat protein
LKAPFTPDSLSTEPSPAASAAAPQIPDYELLRSIGRGAYGDVWLARSLTGVYRAVKIVWRDRFSNAQPYEREFSGLRDFARVSINESRQLALLHVGRNEAAGFFYYVMELADDVESGTVIDPDCYEPLTLTLYREKARRLPVRDIVAHAVELTRALGSLHDHGLIHRDIKPSNIILVKGRPKLADIGLVTAVDSAVTYVGTEGFVPPEGPGTRGADIYSLGKVLYELAMGRDRNDYPRLPEDLQERSDRKELMELNEVILRACDPSPAVRYTNAEALLSELLLLQAGKSVRRLRLTERGLARAKRVAVLLGVLALVTAGGMAIERQRAERESAGRRTAEAERDLLQRQTVYSAILARAQRAIHLGELGRARKILQEAVPKPGEEAQDLRGWEWHVLQNEARGDSTATIMEGPHAIERVVHSLDGTLLAVLDATKTVTILDATTYERLSTVNGVHRLAGFSPDGEWLLGSTSTFALQAWNRHTGAPRGEPQSGGVNRPLAVLPDAPMHLLVFTDGSVDDPPVVRAWDLAEQREVYRIPVGDPGGPLWEFFNGAVSANGKRTALVVISGRRDQAVFRDLALDLQLSRVVREETSTSRPTAIAVSANGEWIARAIGNTAEIEVTEFVSGNVRWKTGMGRSEILGLAFSPSGREVAAGTFSGELHLHEVTGGNIVATLSGQAGTISAVNWRPNGEGVTTAGNGGDARFWSPPFKPRTVHLENLWIPPLTWRISCSEKGLLAVASFDKDTLGLFRPSTLELVGSLKGARYPIWNSDDGSTIITFDQQQVLKWWRMDETVPYDTMDLGFPTGTTANAAIAANGRSLVVGSSTGEVQIWDLENRHLIRSHQAHIGNVRNLSIDSRGIIACSSSQDGVIHFWSVPTGTLRFSLTLRPPILDLTVSDDQNFAAALIGDGIPVLINLEQQRVEKEIDLGGAAFVIKFVDGASRLLCASRSGLLHVYDTQSWREITAIEDYRNSAPGDASLTTMSASRDAVCLLTFSRNGRLRVWSAAPMR